MIQGYDGVTVTDAKHRIVVHAQAYGGSAGARIADPDVGGTRENFRALGAEDVLEQVAVAADSGFHSEVNVKYLFDTSIDGYLADTLFRGATRALPRQGATCPLAPARHGLVPRAMGYSGHAISSTTGPPRPASVRRGNFCIRTAPTRRIRGHEAVKFTGAKRVCGPCTLREKCLRQPERTPVRQVVFFTGRTTGKPETYTAKMKARSTPSTVATNMGEGWRWPSRCSPTSIARAD